MDMTLRYHVVTDQAGSEKMIFDALTGRVQYPHCWQDISAYYHYLVAKGRQGEAQQLLAESMSGSKPMTSMVEKTAQPIFDGNEFH